MEIILVNEPYYLTGFAILKGLPSHYPQTHNAGTADLTSKNHTRTKVHLKWREKVEVAAASSTRTEKRPLAVGDFPSFRRLLAAGASSARGSDQSGYRWRRRSSVEASHCRVQRRLFRIQDGEARRHRWLFGPLTTGPQIGPISFISPRAVEPGSSPSQVAPPAARNFPRSQYTAKSAYVLRCAIQRFLLQLQLQPSLEGVCWTKTQVFHLATSTRKDFDSRQVAAKNVALRSIVPALPSGAWDGDSPMLALPIRAASLGSRSGVDRQQGHEANCNYVHRGVVEPGSASADKEGTSILGGD